MISASVRGAVAGLRATRNTAWRVAVPVGPTMTALRHSSTSLVARPVSATPAAPGTPWPDFVPRKTYEPSSGVPRSYFLGHHRAALDRMRRELATVGLVIECRDLRVPLTAWNPLLETSLSSGVASEGDDSEGPIGSNKTGLLGLSKPGASSPFLPSAYTNRSRIIVYTKRDLVLDAAGQSPSAGDLRRLAAFHRHEADAVLFLGAESDTETHRRSRYAARESTRLLAAVREAVARHGQQSLTELRALVVGMPNAGKSTLLNRLRALGMTDPGRRGRAAKTGVEPGVTRKMGTPVRVLGGPEPERRLEVVSGSNVNRTRGSGRPLGSADQTPSLLLLDTPGVFVPYVHDAESMLKMALVGCVREGLVPPLALADYLLFQLNRRDPRLYVAAYGLSAPTHDLNILLDAIAYRTGKLARGGAPIHEAAALLFIHAWRRGRLGRFCLDDLDADSLAAARAAAIQGGPVSLHQARKREKERRKARAAARHTGVVLEGNFMTG